jgi:glycosyltransferase involved in cell wall biosynthesis
VPATVVRVLVAHNAYQQRGGEDAVVESEVALLRAAGHEVREYRRHNDELASTRLAGAAAGTVWSRRTHTEVSALLARWPADIVHVHNTFPLISPSLHWAANAVRVPLVQTLHNFRLLCPQAMLLRDGRVCQECVGRAPLPAVRHACYRGSRAQTGVLAAMLVLHRGLGTWQRKVQRYVALNTFCRDAFVRGGLPASRIAVKPNFVDAQGRQPAFERRGLLFVGRLSPEKGIGVLAQASAALAAGSVEVAGEGPLLDAVHAAPGLKSLGALKPDAVARAMGGALALVMPSLWFENFPRTLVEAYAAGLPVIASRLGAMAELVEDGVTGLLAEPGDTQDWAAKMRWALEHPVEMARMGDAARARYDALYTPRRNLAQLLDIYQQAVAQGHEDFRA